MQVCFLDIIIHYCNIHSTIYLVGFLGFPEEDRDLLIITGLLETNHQMLVTLKRKRFKDCASSTWVAEIESGFIAFSPA